MAGISVAEAFMRLRVDPSQLRKDIEKGTAGVSTVGKLGKSLTKAVTLPILAAGAAAVKLSVDFNGAMAKIQGLVGVSKRQVQEWSGQVLQLARVLPQSPKELADALFYVTSAGFRGKQAMDVLTISAKAAASGLGETKTVADAVTSALNAYHGSGLTATKVTDTLVAAVTQGKMPADALSAAIGQVLPVAAEMGVSFSEVAGTAAALSRSGANVNRTMTGLRFLLSSLENPASASSKILAKVGISADDIRKSIAEKGLLPTLQMLKDKLPTPDFLKVVGGARGVITALGLVGKNGKQVQEVMDKVKNSTGATSRAFQVASQTAGFKFKAALSSLQATAIQLGSIFIPVLVTMVGWVAKAADWLGRLSPQMQKLVIWIGLVAAAIGPLLIVSAKLIESFRTIKTVFADLQVMSKIGALLTNPWVLLAVAVAVAAYLIITHWNTVKGWFIAFWHWLYNTFAPAVKAVWNGLVTGAQAVVRGWQAVAGFFVGVWNTVIGAFQRFMGWVTANFDKWWAANGAAIKAIWNAVWQGILAVVTPVWNAIVAGAQIGWSILTAVFRLSVAVLTAVWQGWWNVTRAVLAAAWNVMIPIVRGAWGAISAIFHASAGIIIAVWRYIWAVLSQLVRVWWAAVQTIFKVGWDIVVGIFTVFINLLTGHWGRAWNALKAMLVQVWNAIKGFIGVVLSAIEHIIHAAWNLILAVARSVWGGIRGFFTSWWNGLTGAIRNFLSGIGHIIGVAWVGIKSGAARIWGQILNVVKSVWNGIKKVVASPINAVIGFIDKYLIGGVNLILSTIGIKGHGSHGGPIGDIPKIPGYRKGGRLPGFGGGDTVPAWIKGMGPALLEPGEAIVDKHTTRKYAGVLGAMGVPGFRRGGVAGDRERRLPGADLGWTDFPGRVFRFLPGFATGGAVEAKMVQFMTSKVGQAYSQANRWGEPPWDCSSLVWQAAHNAGVPIPRSSSTAHLEANWFGTSSWAKQALDYVYGGNSSIRQGDLVFSRGAQPYQSYYGPVGHVGMALNNKQMISALGTKYGVTVSNISPITAGIRLGGTNAQMGALPNGAINIGALLKRGLSAVGGFVINTIQDLISFLPGPVGSAVNALLGIKKPGGTGAGWVGQLTGGAWDFMIGKVLGWVKGKAFSALKALFGMGGGGGGGTGGPAPADVTAWAKQILAGLGIKPSAGAVQAMTHWAQMEGGNWHNSAKYNPLNTTLNEPGAKSINSVGVKAYTSWSQGNAATIATLKHYSGILAALRAGNYSAVGRAVLASPWGTTHWSTGGLIKRYRSGGRIPEPVLGVGPSGHNFSFGEGERVVPAGGDPLLAELKMLRRAVEGVPARTAAGVAKAVQSPRQTMAQAARVGAR